MVGGLLKNFPEGYDPNSSQVKLLKNIDLITSYTAFKIDQTGSYIHEQECENRLYAGAFALTITKALQDQYKSLFKGTTLLKGKSNYISTIDSDIDVEMESLIIPKNILEDHRRRHKCPYVK